ncbi:zinc-finger double domain-containing protein [Phthorimaea operculella]|nr:zinc-finger double domain-containing protein [Phthorimaea operculella]
MGNKISHSVLNVRMAHWQRQWPTNQGCHGSIYNCDQKWKRGVVESMIASSLYAVRGSDGVVHRRHVDQLLRSRPPGHTEAQAYRQHASDTNSDDDDNDSVIVPPPEEWAEIIGNTDRTSTFADLKLKRIVTADTDVEVKGIDMERSSLLNSANNYTPRNKKTGLTCETKEINTTSNKGSNAPDAFKKLNDILLRCKYNNCGAGAVTDHNSDSSLENEYSCTLCNYATNDAGAFECHSGVHSATSQYICDTCSYVTTEKNILIRHMRSHADGNPFGRKILSIKRLVKIQTDKISYSCKLCTKKFTYRSNLNKHIRIHTGDKPYTCEICDIKFMSRSGLEYHIRTHTGEKRFACKLCDKKFTHKSNLISHSKTHTGEKSFACQICDKKFARKDHLLSHNTTHSGNEPYACKICDKKHIKTHSGDKPYACEICDKKFAQNSNLIAHIKTHGEKRFACKLCDKKFAVNSNLIAHIRAHSGDKPYACEICNKKFVYRSGLVSHIKLHTGEKRFVSGTRELRIVSFLKPVQNSDFLTSILKTVTLLIIIRQILLEKHFSNHSCIANRCQQKHSIMLNNFCFGCISVSPLFQLGSWWCTWWSTSESYLYFLKFIWTPYGAPDGLHQVLQTFVVYSPAEASHQPKQLLLWSYICISYSLAGLLLAHLEVYMRVISVFPKVHLGTLWCTRWSTSGTANLRCLFASRSVPST